MRIIITLLLLLAPLRSHADVDFSDLDIYVGAYRLNLKILKERVRVRPKHNLLCYDEYDYSLLYDHVIDFQTECDRRVKSAKSDRDRICEDSKTQIRQRMQKLVDLCEAQKSALILENKALGESLESHIESHRQAIQTHYIIEGVAGAVIIGLATTLIVTQM